MADYPPYNKIRSTDQMKECYERARKEINSYKNSAKLANASAKGFAKDARSLKAENKQLGKDVVTLTKNQKAAEEAKKAGYWSGAAAISVTILYEVWKIVGFPGGKEWIQFWQHEAVYGVIMWISTMLFGVLYKDVKNFGKKK
jgi:hypothetical protein|tara:strand:+ start:170 stop:598 length:429 start_codon:yes stop_codon:yes gene_type:complete